MKTFEETYDRLTNCTLDCTVQRTYHMQARRARRAGSAEEECVLESARAVRTVVR